MARFDVFLDNCLKVDETSDGKWCVYLEIDDCFSGGKDMPASIPLVGAFELFDEEIDTDGSTCHSFRAFDLEGVSETKQDALEVLKEIKKAIKKTVRRLAKAIK